MNEQRLQAYYQLIQQLLSCADGEESAILQANSELLDADFLQLVVGLAGMFSQEGEENTANWLLGLASQLSEYLNIPLEENTPEAETPVSEADRETYLQFLLEVLQATAESTGNPQVVYPLLAANTDKLNLTFANLLQAWATTTIAEAEPETAQFLAAVIVELGNLIQQFPLGNKANNMEIAITGYEIAFTVFTRQTFPEYWAMTQNSLGNAYGDRIRGDKAQNLENAIAAYTAALEVFTRDDFPVDWAMMQNNLGNAYRNRIRGDKAQNLENAIKAYTAALEVRTRHDFPVYYVETAYLISIAYRKSGRLILAYLFLEEVINNLQLLNSSNQKHLIYSEIIHICLALDESTLAIEYIESSKNRILIENIHITILKAIKEEKSDLKDKALKKINNISLAKLKNLRKQEEFLIKANIGSTPIQYPEIQNLLDDKTAIIQFYIFNDCFRAFIITRNNDKPIIWQSTEADLTQLIYLIYYEYLTLYSEDRNRWRNELNNQLTKLAEILQLNQIIAQVPHDIQKIIIIPHRYLHLLPFHAIPLSAGEYLIDKYPAGVSYAPSCQLLNLAQIKVENNPVTINQNFTNFDQSLLPDEQTRLNNLFAIQNPTKDLKFTDIEVETIANNFNSHKILKHEQASKAAFKKDLTLLTDSQWLHFSCHGSFNSISPLKSALQFANSEVKPELTETSSSEKCLTLEEILELELSQCYLVCLSACETGVIDFSNNSDGFYFDIGKL